MNRQNNGTKDERIIDRVKTYAILQWLNRNPRMLVNSYKNQYVAHNEKQLIVHSESL